MKSSQFITTFVVAIVLAAIGFFLAGVLGVNGQTVAISVLVGAILSPLISSQLSSASSEKNGEVTTLYVGNLPYRANESAVRELFSAHGSVHSVRLMKDKHTGKRRGFGFVEIAASDSAGAISALNDTEFQQRTLKVREAKERPERSDPQE